MKLEEAMRRVDRRPENATNPNIDEFCAELGLDHCCCGWSDAFSARVQGYWLQKWLCTDTWVGMIVWCLDDTPIAISTQAARRADREYRFVSAAAAARVSDLILELHQPDAPRFQLADLSEELPDSYAVTYASQLLVKEGLVAGLPCTVVERTEGYGAQSVTVAYADGGRQTVRLEAFRIPLGIV